MIRLNCVISLNRTKSAVILICLRTGNFAFDNWQLQIDIDYLIICQSITALGSFKINYQKQNIPIFEMSIMVINRACLTGILSGNYNSEIGVITDDDCITRIQRCITCARHYVIKILTRLQCVQSCTPFKGNTALSSSDVTSGNTTVQSHITTWTRRHRGSYPIA